MDNQDNNSQQPNQPTSPASVINPPASAPTFHSADIHRTKSGTQVQYFADTQRPPRQKKRSLSQFFQKHNKQPADNTSPATPQQSPASPSQPAAFFRQLSQRRIKVFKKDFPLLPIIIFAGALIIIAILAIAITVTMTNPSTPAQSDIVSPDDPAANNPNYVADGTEEEIEGQIEATEPSLDDRALDTLKSSGLAAFLAVYQAEIDAATDDGARSNLYLDRSDTLLNAYLEDEDDSYKNQIVQDALTAEQLAPSAVTANHVSNVYYAFGDEEHGAQYENLYHERESAEGL